MPILRVPYKWAYKPPTAEIEAKVSNSPYAPAADPVVHGLGYAPLLSEGTGTIVRDSVSMTNGTFSGSNGSWTLGPFGPALKISNIMSATGNSLYSYAYFDNITNWSMSAWTSPYVLDGCGVMMSNGFSHGVQIYFGWNVSGQIAVDITGVSARLSGFSYPDLAPNWHHVCVTSSISGALSLYFDGRLVASGFDGGFVPDYIGDVLSVGGCGTSGKDFYGDIDLPRYWTRQLSAVEVMREYTDPLWIYRKPASHQFVYMSGATDETEGPMFISRQMIETW